MKPQTDRQTEGGGESLDKGEKFPFPPLRRFIRSAVGLWEGPPLLVCFSLLLLRTFTSIHQLSSPSIHPLPPFYDLFLWVFVPFIQILYSLPPPLLAIFLSVAASVFLWGIGKTVREETPREWSHAQAWIGNREERERKCSCSSSAFTVSRCCCWLDVIRWDSVGENRSVLVEKLQSSIFIRTFLFPPWKRIAFLTSFSRLLFLFLGMPHIETNYTHIKASLRLTTHPLPPLPVHSEGVKVGRRWSYGIRTLSRRIKEISIKAVQPFREQTHCCGPPTSQSLLVLNTF